jgi:hypothetical protein
LYEHFTSEFAQISKNHTFFVIQKLFAIFGDISHIVPISCHLAIIFAVLPE